MHSSVFKAGNSRAGNGAANVTMFHGKEEIFFSFFFLLLFLIQTLQMEKAGVNRMNSYVALPCFLC